MKKTTSLISNLVLSSTLLLGLTTVEADELVFKRAADASAYCHMKFPPMRQETISWAQPVLDESAGNIIDFYGPCDRDPTGPVERARQKRNGSRGESD